MLVGMARTVKQDLLTRCFTLPEPGGFGDLKAVELHCHFREDLVKNEKVRRKIEFADELLSAGVHRHHGALIDAGPNSAPFAWIRRLPQTI